MNERRLLRDIEPVCYSQAGYLCCITRGQRRSRKRKELYRACIRLWCFDADGRCSIREIDDDYRYEYCVFWWNNIHKNKPYKYKL